MPMRYVLDRLYLFHIHCDAPGFLDHLDRWLTIAETWEDPKLDKPRFP